MLKTGKNILICPLEWGLGHAGRMVAVAARLRDMDNNIFIGAGNEIRSFFNNELPGLSYIHFPGFRPGYSSVLPQYLVLLLKTPVMIYHIVREHINLKNIIRDNKIDIVISDNRFGLWNRSVRTVYITHMPRIPFPRGFKWLEFSGIYLHRFIIKQYSLCLIPDLPGEMNVSGRLSHGLDLPGNVMYTGILSRFSTLRNHRADKTSGFPHNTVILSGPEPQRSILKQKLVRLLKDNGLPTIFLEGKPGEEKKTGRSGNIVSFNHLPASEMQKVITGSNSIVSRPGYSSVMELISLKCSALLIPTPGQTEQEYLAEYLSEKGWFVTIPQKDLGEDIELPAIKAVWTDEMAVKSEELLEAALEELLKY